MPRGRGGWGGGTRTMSPGGLPPTQEGVCTPEQPSRDREKKPQNQDGAGKKSPHPKDPQAADGGGGQPFWGLSRDREPRRGPGSHALHTAGCPPIHAGRVQAEAQLPAASNRQIVLPQPAPCPSLSQLPAGEGRDRARQPRRGEKRQGDRQEISGHPSALVLPPGPPQGRGTRRHMVQGTPRGRFYS